MNRQSFNEQLQPTILTHEEAQEIARRVQADEEVAPEKVAQLLEYLRVNTLE